MEIQVEKNQHPLIPQIFLMKRKKEKNWPYMEN